MQSSCASYYPLPPPPPQSPRNVFDANSFTPSNGMKKCTFSRSVFFFYPKLISFPQRPPTQTVCLFFIFSLLPECNQELLNKSHHQKVSKSQWNIGLKVHLLLHHLFICRWVMQYLMHSSDAGSQTQKMFAGLLTHTWIEEYFDVGEKKKKRSFRASFAIRVKSASGINPRSLTSHLRPLCRTMSCYQRHSFICRTASLNIVWTSFGFKKIMDQFSS